MVRRPEKWGSLNFETGEATMDRLRQLATLINELPFDLAPEANVQNATAELNGARETLSQIDGFDSELSTRDHRDQLVGTLD